MHQYAHLIIAQRDRHGYSCTRCRAFHRDGEAAFEEHAPDMSREGLTLWVDTLVLGIDPAGNAERLPAALGLAAIARAEAIP